MNFFKRASTPDQENAFRQSLEAIPARNAAAKVLPTQNPNEIEIEVTLTYGSVGMRVLRTILKPSDKKKYLLDKIGKRVYESIDGKKKFGVIVDEFAAAEKLTFFESRALVGQYMSTLVSRGLIVATFPKI